MALPFKFEHENKKKKQNYSRIALLALISIIFKLIDFASDMYLFSRYLIDRKMLYCSLTLSFIYIPSIISFIITERMSHRDRKREEIVERLLEEIRGKRVKNTKTIRNMIAAIVALHPAVYDYDIIKYAQNARNCYEKGERACASLWHLKMIEANHDNTLLKVIESFLEAAFQTTLQVVLLMIDHYTNNNIELGQIIAIFVSIFGMAWSVVNYNHARKMNQEEDIIAVIHKVTMHAFMIGSRILCISALASIWPWYTTGACTLHCLAMIAWIMFGSQKIFQSCTRSNHDPDEGTGTIRKYIYSILISSVLGIVYLYTYLDFADENLFTNQNVKFKIKKKASLYMIFTIENLGSVILWFYITTEREKMTVYFEIFLLFCMTSYFISITAMSLNYVMSDSKTNEPTQDNLVSETFQIRHNEILEHFINIV